jgi:SAM-dependent methyltransferase
MLNSYSRTWFELFLETRPYTEQETAFVTRNLPNPPYTKVLDLCCGQGRHTNLLAQQGYQMVGLDLDDTALSLAKREATGIVTYIQKDMRKLDELPGNFDAVISLWQSFGYFDAATNRDILQQISQKLHPQGRLILDIYNREFFEKHQGSGQLERKGVIIRVTNTMRGDRLTAHLEYGDNLGADTFEWRLYTLDEICDLAAGVNLRCLLACTECNEQKPATTKKPQMQLVFERDD